MSGRAAGVLLALIALTVSLQPVDDEGLWWHLSRGRTVLAGSLAPSRDLLVAETMKESDWLGGVPAYLAYSVLGPTGLMVLGLGVAGVLAAGLWRVRPGGFRWFALLIVAATLVAAGDAASSAPLAWDVLGVLCIWLAARRWRGSGGIAWLIPLLAVTLLWANSGPRAVLALGVLGSVLFDGRPSRRRTVAGRSAEVVCRLGDHATTRPHGWETMRQLRSYLAVVCLTALLCCATPRGSFAPWDSLQRVVPLLSANAGILAGTTWQPLASEAICPETLAFMVLSLAAMALLAWRPGSVACLGWFGVIQVVAWSSAGNLAPASVWLGLFTLAHLRYCEDELAALFAPILQWERLIMGSGLVLAVTISIGGFSPMLGWGIAPQLDPRLLQRTLHNLELNGTAHCTGVRAAGMLAWLDPQHVRPYDVPARALLGDRLRGHVLLNTDLRKQSRTRYRRADGSWGGWWIPLQKRDTCLILLSAEETTLIRALEPSLWKPLSLDSPVLPYGRSGERSCSPQIVEILQQRDFVNGGRWRYSLPAMDNALHVNFWRALTEAPPLGDALRQARVFRAMQQHVAALKILHVLLRKAACKPVLAEFAQCQLEIAYQERVQAGRAGLFRTLAWLKTTTSPPETRYRILKSLGFDEASGRMRQVLASPAERSQPLDPLFGNVPIFRSGSPHRAAELLSGDDAEILYARACLLLEAGRPQESAAVLDRLIGRHPRHRAAVLARNLRETLVF